MFLAICLTTEAQQISHFLIINLAVFDFMFVLSKLVERILDGTLQSLSHSASHGSFSCLILLLIHRVILTPAERNSNIYYFVVTTDIIIKIVIFTSSKVF